MNRKRYMILVLVMLLAGCEATPASSPTPVPTTPTSTPTPVPPTATLTPPTATAEPFPVRSYPDVIIADFEASPWTWIPKMDWLREIGVNTIIIHLAYLRDSGEEYELVYPYPSSGPTSEDYVRQLIVTARKEGFAVMLGPMVGRLGDPHVPIEQIDDWNRFLADSTEIVVRWAAIAEELEVEYFMPFCELGYVLEAQECTDAPGEPRYSFDEVMALIAEWDSEAVPQIRDVYSGKLINQIYSSFPGSLLHFPVTGYDIVGLTYHPYGMEEVTDGFREVLEDAQTLAQREGIDWMAVEVDMHLGADADGREPLEIEADLWRLAAEVYLEEKAIPPIGFGTSFDVTVEGYTSDEGTPSEEVLREFFAALRTAWEQ